MEREANYAAVGAFVLIVLLIGGLFVYWYSDSREHHHYEHYEVYFNGTVSGLERGSTVRYLGVGVGKVARMRIDPRDPGRVQVVVDIDATTPISDKTLAELRLQGLTGLLYIDLKQSQDTHAEKSLVPSLDYPVIRSIPSRFDVFLQNLPELVASVADVVERADRLLSDSNLGSISDAVANIDKASAGLPNTVRQLDSLVTDLRGATSELSASMKTARGIVNSVGPDVVSTVARFHEVADNLSNATDQLNKIIGDNRQDLRSFTRDGLPEIERFVREGRAAAEEIRGLSSSLRENPSQLIYQQSEQGVRIPQ